MADTLAAQLGDWDGLAVVCRHDPEAEAWIFVALHDDTLGTPTGGTRMRVYPRPEDGLRDAQRLARGMTHKWASIELGFGGGKAVLALSRPLDPPTRRGLLERYGGLLNALRGAFGTGQDLGTTPDDMRVVARISPHVHGFDAEADATRDPGPFTALGVFRGLVASWAQVSGKQDLHGCVVLVQGVGDVGAPLARHCAAAGAKLLIADADEPRARALAEELSAETVAAERVYDTPCDVLAPCAVGAILNAESIPRLRCRVVAGAANNQLAGSEDAERLHARGILYAPDYVINAGGALAFGLLGQGERDEAVLRGRVSELGTVLRTVFAEAQQRDESPLHAARRRVERVLEQARARRSS